MAQVKGFLHQESQLWSGQPSSLLPLQPAGHGAEWAPLSAPNSSTLKAQAQHPTPQEPQDLHMGSSPAGIKGFDKGTQPLLFPQRRHLICWAFILPQAILSCWHTLSYYHPNGYWNLFLWRGQGKSRGGRTDAQSGEITCQKAQEQRQNLNLSYDAKFRSLCPLTGCFRMIEIV